jgi:hypothetical protein
VSFNLLKANLAAKVAVRPDCEGVVNVIHARPHGYRFAENSGLREREREPFHRFQDITARASLAM